MRWRSSKDENAAVPTAAIRTSGLRKTNVHTLASRPQSAAGFNFQGGSFALSDRRADELIARTVSSDDLAALHDYQDFIAHQLPVIWVPNFPFRLLEVDKRLRGVEPLNPYGLLTPENWYFAED